MNRKQKTEIKQIIKSRVKNIVEERIIPELNDEISEWTCDLVGDLTLFDDTQEDSLDEALEIFHEALITETKNQLSNLLTKK